MTPALTLNLFRALFVAFTSYIGFQVGGTIFPSAWVGFLGGAAFGLAIVLADRLLKGVSLRLFSSATFGLFMGALFAKLLLASDVLRTASDEVQWVAGLLVYATCAYLGTMLAVRSNREDFSLIIPYIRFRESAVQDAPLVLDASAILDGRVGELCGTGFLSNSLVVPRFVLDELQRMSGSEEALIRERGRRGLTRFEELQSRPGLLLSIHEGDAGEEPANHPSRLIRLARLLDARLLTNDATLVTAARLQGVSPLNLTDLARALRPVLAVGDVVELELAKEGREPHQAVGHLPDGAMIVVNHARSHIGLTLPVTISSIVQTTAGRLLFAELTK